MKYLIYVLVFVAFFIGGCVGYSVNMLSISLPIEKYQVFAESDFTVKPLKKTWDSSEYKKLNLVVKDVKILEKIDGVMSCSSFACMGIDWYNQQLRVFNSTMVIELKGDKLKTGEPIEYVFYKSKTICNGVIVVDKDGYERIFDELNIINMTTDDLPENYKHGSIKYDSENCDQIDDIEHIFVDSQHSSLRCECNGDVFQSPIIISSDKGLHNFSSVKESKN